MIIRPGAIGDFIVSLPALEFLRADYTEVWATEATAPLARFADRAVSLYSTGIDAGRLEALGGFDSIVSWYGSNRPEFRQAVRGLPVQFHAALPSGSQHAVDFYLEQVGAPVGAVPRIPCLEPKRDFIAIQPFSGSPRKNWPLARFRELAARLPLPVEFAAGPEEPLDGALRFDGLWDLARWLASARLYVGNDSGVSHLAAAVGTPVIAIFGPTDPAVWAPRGALVDVVRADGGAPDHVTVGDVLKPALERSAKIVEQPGLRPL